MLFCPVCRVWVQPIQWVDSAYNGQVFLLEACPTCHEKLPATERAPA